MRVLILFVIAFCGLAFAQEVVTAIPLVPVVVDPVVEAPPEWLLQMIAILKAMPVVGPYVAMGVQWLGVFASMTTVLCAALWGSIRILSTVVKTAGFIDLASKILGWENSKFMNIMKMFSLFNAQKKVG